MIGRRIVPFALSLLVFVFAASPMSARAENLEADASAFIESLADEAIQALANKDIPRVDRISKFRTLFTDHFAINGIGKFVLGRHWNKATDAEKKEYLQLFEDLMVISYVDRFTEYAGESLTIEKAIAPDPKKITVFTKIVKPGSDKAYAVNWRLGKGSQGFKVVDVVVEGTSMSTTLRSDFGSIIRRKGNKVSGLIEELKLKTEALQ